MNQYSHYYVEETFKEKIDAEFKGKAVFSLCHINIKNLKAGISELTDYFNSFSQEFSVIGLGETWLTELNFDIYNIAGYTQCFKLWEAYQQCVMWQS